MLAELYRAFEERQHATLAAALARSTPRLETVAALVAGAYVDCCLAEGRELSDVVAALAGSSVLTAVRQEAEEAYLAACRDALAPFGTLDAAAVRAVVGPVTRSCARCSTPRPARTSRAPPSPASCSPSPTPTRPRRRPRDHRRPHAPPVPGTALWVSAHPRATSLNGRLTSAGVEALSARWDVLTSDLYAQDFDPVLRSGDVGDLAGTPGNLAEQLGHAHARGQLPDDVGPSRTSSRPPSCSSCSSRCGGTARPRSSRAGSTAS